MHRILEFPFRKTYSATILELGAGEGFHRRFVTSGFQKYVETDISERANTSGPSEKITFRQENAEELTFDDNTFERTIATCLIAHLDRPTEALGHWRRVTKNNGWISIYIPCEPGILLRCFRAIFLLPKSKLSGTQDFNFRIASEHRNSY